MANIVTTEAIVVRNGELHIRQIAAEIADIFDNLLDEHGIMIPDEGREGAESEAALFGSTYSDFEDVITEQLVAVVTGVRAGGADITVTKEVIYQSFVALLQKHNLAVPGDKQDLWQSMDRCIAELLEIVAKHTALPVNEWEY